MISSSVSFQEIQGKDVLIHESSVSKENQDPTLKNVAETSDERYFFIFFNRIKITVMLTKVRNVFSGGNIIWMKKLWT